MLDSNQIKDNEIAELQKSIENLKTEAQTSGVF